MKKPVAIASVVLGIFLLTATLALHPSSTTEVAPAPNGIALPEGYRNWRLISSSHRTDNNTLRVILGNDVAVQAARDGRTNPWPDGSVLAKLVWGDTTHEDWPAATVPGEFVHAEFMLKDTDRFSSTGGWGFARWLGLDEEPYGEGPDFVQECYGCHAPVKDNDYVFTKAATLP